MDITSAAMELFSQKGFHSTRITDIASNLDIASGTVYLYFKNKKELFAHVMDTYLARFVTLFSNEKPDLSNDIASFKKQLQRIGDEIFVLFISDEQMFKIMFRQSIDTDPAIDTKLALFINQLNQFTEKYLINGINKGFLKGSINTQTTAKAVNGMIFTGVSDIMRNNSSPELKQQWIDSISVLMIDGLLKNVIN